MKQHLVLLGITSLCLSACSTNEPPRSPESPTLDGPAPNVSAQADPPKTPGGDPFELTGLKVEEWLPMLKGPLSFAETSLAKAPKGTRPAPKSCEVHAKRKAVAKTAPNCGARDATLPLLDMALEAPDEAARDQALVELEACAGLPAGLVRSLRVELLPLACGDALIEPFLAAAPKGIEGAIEHALVGQAIAARLSRTAQEPPKLSAPFTKTRVLEFVKGPMTQWMGEQAQAIEELSRAGATLSYYGKGLVALAAGTADLRVVDTVRQVPIPDEFRTDPELADAYYAGLDLQLEPRKTRGRDGALVGLREMAHAGVISDARVQAARGLLAKLFGGRRVDALDALVLASPVAPDDKSVSSRLAARLPTFHAGLLLAPESALDPSVLRSLSSRGVPVVQRIALKNAEAELADEVRTLYASARLMMGIRYWRDEDFDAAAHLLAAIPSERRSKEARFGLALAIGLRHGPDDVAALMLKNEGFGANFGDVRALDVVAKEDTTLASGGRAAYDAAVIRQIASPRDAAPAYWEALAQRYEQASKLLADPATKLEATLRAKAAAAAAKAIATAEP